MADSVPNFVPTLKPSGRSEAITFHFTNAKHDFGWALCTVNNTTGELQIMSDWGNWAHMWSPKPEHLGAPSLMHFIADRNACHYLADKLCVGNGPRSGEEFDVDATLKRMRRELAERRLEQGREVVPALSERRARELWDDLGSLVDCGRSADLFLERFYRIDGASRWIAEEPWEQLEYSPTTGYLVLLHGILPALVEACRDHIAKAAT